VYRRSAEDPLKNAPQLVKRKSALKTAKQNENYPQNPCVLRFMRNLLHILFDAESKSTLGVDMQWFVPTEFRFSRLSLCGKLFASCRGILLVIIS
jgi:hypothetical protein